MTRKDFELIAKTIRNAEIDDTARLKMAFAFAEALQETNPRFDRARFIDATYNISKA